MNKEENIVRTMSGYARDWEGYQAKLYTKDKNFTNWIVGFSKLLKIRLKEIQ